MARTWESASPPRSPTGSTRYGSRRTARPATRARWRSSPGSTCSSRQSPGSAARPGDLRHPRHRGRARIESAAVHRHLSGDWMDRDMSGPVAPYADNWEHIADELARVELLVRAHLARMGVSSSESGPDPLRGLYLSGNEVQRLLSTEAHDPPAD